MFVNRQNGARGLLSLVLSALAPTDASANPTNMSVSYQGRLEQSGTPVDEPCDFQFSLWDALSGPNQVGATQTLINVNVTNGLFTVMLNAGGQFGAAAWNGEDRWLEIAVRCPAGAGGYTTLSPRQKLTPSPYAQRACTGVGGPDAINVTSAGDVGIGTDAPNEKLVVADAIKAAVSVNRDVASGQIEQNALGGALRLHNLVGATLVQLRTYGASYFTGGNVGIGTTTPAAPLDVKGGPGVKAIVGDVATGFSANLVTGDVIVSNGAGAATEGLYLSAVSGLPQVGAIRVGGAPVPPLTFQVNNVERMRITPSGDVGIGTTTPAAKLDVSGAFKARGLRTEVTNPENVIGGQSTNVVTNGAGGVHIGGGFGHDVSAFFGVIGGGEMNAVTDFDGVVGGGAGNIAGNADGDTGNAVATVIGGGAFNAAVSDFATIGGGQFNVAQGTNSTIAGGGAVFGGFTSEGNVVADDHGTIGGGQSNRAGAGSTTTDDPYATVAGGRSNAATAAYSAIAGGDDNLAAGEYSAVPGGRLNDATGDYSVAAGRRAKANHNGAFVWADSTDADIASTGNNQFIVRAAGGMWLGLTSSPSFPAGRFINTSTGGYLDIFGTWQNASDLERKEDFQSVDGRDVLARLCRMPISNWRFKGDAANTRHIGPVAQDFHAAFAVGCDDRAIGTLDADGVALAAIQGLHQIVKEKDGKIAELEARLARLEALATMRLSNTPQPDGAE